MQVAVLVFMRIIGTLEEGKELVCASSSCTFIDLHLFACILVCWCGGTFFCIFSSCCVSFHNLPFFSFLFLLPFRWFFRSIGHPTCKKKKEKEKDRGREREQWVHLSHSPQMKHTENLSLYLSEARNKSPLPRVQSDLFKEKSHAETRLRQTEKKKKLNGHSTTDFTCETAALFSQTHSLVTWQTNDYQKEWGTTGQPLG